MRVAYYFRRGYPGGPIDERWQEGPVRHGVHPDPTYSYVTQRDALYAAAALYSPDPVKYVTTDEGGYHLGTDPGPPPTTPVGDILGAIYYETAPRVPVWVAVDVDWEDDDIVKASAETTA